MPETEETLHFELPEWLQSHPAKPRHLGTCCLSRDQEPTLPPHNVKTDKSGLTSVAGSRTTPRLLGCITLMCTGTLHLGTQKSSMDFTRWTLELEKDDCKDPAPSTSVLASKKSSHMASASLPSLKSHVNVDC